jgi:hypothetical protein
MISIHFSVKRKTGENKEFLGKISSIGFHIIEQPNVKKGLVRLTTISKDKFKRLKNNQLVVTPDGLGTIRNYAITRDTEGQLIQPGGVNVRVRNLNKNKTYYNLNHIQVIDIIDSISGSKYPVIESDYPMLLVDDAPVEFVINKANRANLSLRSRKQYADVKIFAKKQGGITILNELIKKGLWTPIEK